MFFDFERKYEKFWVTTKTGCSLENEYFFWKLISIGLNEKMKLRKKVVENERDKICNQYWFF